MSLRAATLASRFFLIFLLARFLEPEQFGLYGLITATIGYSVYFVGLDFYMFMTREVLKRDSQEWGGLLKNQGALLLVLYAIFTPFLSLIFFKNLLPWKYSGWFFALLILEHMNLELSRLLTAVSRQISVSVMLFLRHGAWTISVVAMMMANPENRSLDYVLGSWTATTLVATIYGAYCLVKFNIGGWQRKVDWRWIARGLKVSSSLLIATLALRGISTLDRYWLQSLGGLEVLAAYVLFTGISGTLMTFLDAGVYSFNYPGMINAHQKEQPTLFRKNLRSMATHTLIFSLAFSATSLLIIQPLLKWLGNPVYTSHQYIYPWILAAMVIYALSMIPHYALYAQSIDRPIIQSHIASVIAFIISTFIFSQHWPLLAVPIGLCTAFALILLWKTWAFFKVTPRNYR